MDEEGDIEMMDGDEPDVVVPPIIANTRRCHTLIDISLRGDFLEEQG